MSKKLIELTRELLRKEILGKNPLELVNLCYYEEQHKKQIQQAIDNGVCITEEIINSYPLGTFKVGK